MSDALLLRASAGTGKTYQLVERYVRALEHRRLRPGHVVAITFTRKAAGELRDRIRKKLALGAAPEVASELARAPINNFHGLALQLLTEAGPSAGLPASPRVLGEQGEDGRLFVESCEQAWLGDDAAVGDDVEALARFFDVTRELPRALWDVLQRAREDAQAIAPEALLARGRRGEVEAVVSAGLADLRSQLAQAARLSGAGPRQKLEAALALAPAGPPGGDLLAWARAWRRAVAGVDRRGKSVRELVSEATLKLAKDDAVPMLEAEAVVQEVRPRLARLITAAWARYAELKDERRAVDFGDLVERAVALLESSEAMHARVCRRYRVVLVDEAQDTNRLQRRFVHLLAGLEGPAAGREPPADLVVVGDRKQAIYTFRGADPQSFEAFADDVRRLGGSELQLHDSYRSTAGVCEAVNHLGASLFPDGYEPITAARPDASAARGGVRWLELPEARDADEAALAEASCVAGLVAARVRAGEAPDRFAILLSSAARAPVFAAALLAEGVPAVVGGGGGLYALPEVQALAALVAWACDPQDRLAAAVALRSPLFGLSDGALLRLLGPASEHALGRLRRGEVPAGLSGGDSDGAALAAAAMPRLTRAARVAPPDVFLRLADELLDVEAVALAMPGGEQRLAGVRRLLALAAEFARAESADTRRFARELATRIDAGAREPLGAAAGRGAVCIGTVHQAKGLEFPVVVLADLAHRPRGDRGCLVYSAGRGILARPRLGGQVVAGLAWREAQQQATAVELAEQARLLYVAVTRAERELVFVGPAGAAATGFMRFLDPWRDRAAAEGVLAVEAVQPAAAAPAAAPAQAIPDHDAWVWADGVVRELGRAPLPDGARFSLAVTELESLLQCLRRGALRAQLRVTEPGRPWTRPEREGGDPPLDPLARGRLAHAVLARLDTAPSATDPAAFVRDGVAALGYDPADPRLSDVLRDATRFLASPRGARLASLPRDQRRHELPFVHRLAAGPYEVALFGQIDLLYADAEGPVVVDFKYARPTQQAIDSYRLQLEAYALAVASLCHVDGPIRTWLVFLGAGTEVGHVVTPEARAALTRRIAEVVSELARVQRSGEVWPGIERADCERLGCGFVGACHSR